MSSEARSAIVFHNEILFHDQTINRDEFQRRSLVKRKASDFRMIVSLMRYVEEEIEKTRKEKRSEPCMPIDSWWW
jgi:hypothetical protein